MFDKKSFLYLIFVHCIIAVPQINLYFTIDEVSENEYNDRIGIQYNCLRLPSNLKDASITQQISSYCMSESSRQFHIEHDIPSFSFVDLAKKKVTSENLFIWSAPLDIVEQYQMYLETNDSSLEKQSFYNCTLPRFGPMCQYELYYYHENYSSLYEIVHNYYKSYYHQTITKTCYTHLTCRRGYSPACLDWTEICDGKVDCIDGDYDEDHCWQLELNECEQDEYQCANGLCIPREFVRDDNLYLDCIDTSDEKFKRTIDSWLPLVVEPAFGIDDIVCHDKFISSSCISKYELLTLESMFSVKDRLVSDECWTAFKCYFAFSTPRFPKINITIINEECIPIIRKDCPAILYIPSIPIFFGHVYTAFKKNELTNSFVPSVPYLCSNKYFSHNFVLDSSLNDTTCFKAAKWTQIVLFDDLSPVFRFSTFMEMTFQQIKLFQPIVNFPIDQYNQSNVYQCSNSSKYIPFHRFLDAVFDCPYKDDENIIEHIDPHLPTQFQNKYYKCHMTNKYITQSAISNGKCDCEYVDEACEDEDLFHNFTRRTISFQTMCDGFQELYPITIDGQNQTDETQCEPWECDNMYTRCDQIWNCLDGKDEMNCDNSPPLLNCSSDSRMCVTLDTYQLICLPLRQINDGQIHCLGGTDERMLCRPPYSRSDAKFYCVIHHNRPPCIQSGVLCDGKELCADGEDERFCNKSQSFPLDTGICNEKYEPLRTDVEKFLFDTVKGRQKAKIKYFRITGFSQSSDHEINEQKPTNQITLDNKKSLSLLDLPRCHRGLDVRVWLNQSSNFYTRTCFCPPTYYGKQCQYQNQRVSVVMRFHVPAQSRRTLFAILVMLIDDSSQRTVHSYEQFTYLSIRDCKIKFNFYLLYSTRPKRSNRSYSVHIDVYERFSLTYRTSFIYPVKFSFLPVHRLAFIVKIPSDESSRETCSDKECLHGKCMKYANTQHSFCQCHRGWMGASCDIPYNCTCSSNSLCVGVSSYNRSICVCQENYFGSECYLRNRICDESPCENNGICVTHSDLTLTNQKYFCICAKGFSGRQCRLIDTRIKLIFEKNIDLSHSVFIHFVRITPFDEFQKNIPKSSPQRSTKLQTITQASNSLRLYWSGPFHLTFIETLHRTYYLSVIQPIYNRSIGITRQVRSSDRCPSINELANETFARLHVLQRMKSYHLICQASPNLECFHDDIHLCLCYDHQNKRLANCFNFDHQMKFDCFGRNHCENDGQCFQDSPDCPKQSICVCRSCYYGSLCQFSTKEFGLSLDAILAYHIIPGVNIFQQTLIVNISFSLTVLFILVGLINAVGSFITFKNKTVLKVGCGVYLLGSSITTILTIVLFAMKYFVYLSTQISTSSNRIFLQIQCHSIDFLLRLCLNMDQWLNACVSMERATMTIQGARFVKKKSKDLAKKHLILLLILMVLTSIHDPLHRSLLQEENDSDDDTKRIWCVVKYSSSLQTYNRIVNTFHFFAPFLINFTSSIVLIITKSRQKLRFREDQTYKRVLHEQVREHQHLLIAPVVLCLLALPRLILSYVSKCMNSSKDSWIFLIGYFISFIPTVITFLIFVLPSKFYRTECRKSITQYRNQIQQRFRRTQ
ncbi:unnamed protein product [Adineta ricciae]|uniref:Uncharacterized protein n=1 Tax=Adineta ricciae TaxID=249248 RepID=A0A815T7C7_ADIRI|nr:unnamed protein product [Adineta ricciae]